MGRLWKGKDAKPYYDLIESLQYQPGVPEAMRYVKSKGYLTAIISASSMDQARRVQRDFGIDYIFANDLIIRDGKISGEFLWPVAEGLEKKANILKKLCAQLGISPSECIYIGDSDWDAEAFKIVGMSIAFNCASDELKKIATHVVEGNNLADAIKYIP